MRKVCIYIVLCVVLMSLCASVLAGEHDYQQWNLLNVGRLVTLSRLDRECRQSQERLLTCSVSASQDALDKLKEVGEFFGCQSMGGGAEPQLSYLEPLTAHDEGPLVIAEFSSVHCKRDPTRQVLIPVTPGEFASMCSRITWKCDVVWISDSDPTVWFVARSGDLMDK